VTSADSAQEAVVVFETDSAAKTALLLTNALIVDRPITVVPHVPSVSDLEADPAVDITNRNHTAPDADRTKTSVVASMIAAGYHLGADAVGRARELDEKHLISVQLKVGADQIKAKASEIDTKLHISETASFVKDAAVAKAQEVDASLHITATVGAAADAVKYQANALATKVNENEMVSKGLGYVQAVGQNIQKQFQTLKEETDRAIEEKKLEKLDGSTEVPAPAAPAPAPSTH